MLRGEFRSLSQSTNTVHPLPLSPEERELIFQFNPEIKRLPQSRSWYESDAEFAKYSGLPTFDALPPSILQENAKALVASIASSCNLNESLERTEEICRKVLRVADKKIRKAMFAVGSPENARNQTPKRQGRVLFRADCGHFGPKPAVGSPELTSPNPPKPSSSRSGNRSRRKSWGSKSARNPSWKSRCCVTWPSSACWTRTRSST